MVLFSPAMTIFRWAVFDSTVFECHAVPTELRKRDSMESQNNRTSYPNIDTFELTSEYVSFLEQFNPNIQENIVSAFNNEMARNHRRKNFIKTVHNLDTILLSLDNTKIELSKLTLEWLPDFKVINLGVNLCKLCLDIDFKLDDLPVSGNYEVNNVALQNVLPVSSNGAITVVYTDVTVKGRVGLLIQGDSFVPENYDVDYTWNSEVSVSYFINRDTKVEAKVTRPTDDQIIAKTIWTQLKEVLTTILKDQLKGVVVEYSVQESLADEDEKLRQLAQSQLTKANGLFDTLLCAAKDYLVAKDLRTIETPPFEVLYRGKLSSTETGLFESGNGYIKDLSTLSRLSDLSLFEDERQLLVYGTLGMREFKHGYDSFKTKFEDNDLTGSLKAQVRGTEIFVKLSFEKSEESPQKTKVEKIETRLLRDTAIDTSGLGSLSWLIPTTQSWVLGHLRSTSMDILLKQIEAAFSYAIEAEMKKTTTTGSDGDNSRLFWKNIFSK
ncbi:uncharacterized protein LOC109538960 isoform X2 [Dendroctonus ponderosae]|uniref:uncharacterized protein LOC109538960 isoform X2 n=2 Tax=Dendroctonus ponderosae TaxID=77166 RepID=UPI0020356B9C|nr:uncharacterized protein LOC109538960 isoform X2 [Dendroctonus ponderosae]